MPSPVSPAPEAPEAVLPNASAPPSAGARASLRHRGPHVSYEDVSISLAASESSSSDIYSEQQQSLERQNTHEPVRRKRCCLQLWSGASVVRGGQVQLRAFCRRPHRRRGASQPTRWTSRSRPNGSRRTRPPMPWASTTQRRTRQSAACCSLARTRSSMRRRGRSPRGFAAALQSERTLRLCSTWRRSLAEERAWPRAGTQLCAHALAPGRVQVRLHPQADGHAPRREHRCVLPHHCAASSRLPRGRYLTEGAAAAGARAGYREYARAAWRFLNSHGYINFGVSPELIARSLAAPADKGHVIVVGAGLAGARALGPAGRPRRGRPSHARTARACAAPLTGATRLQAWGRRGSCACLATA